MSRRLVALFVVPLLALPCLAEKPRIDWDREYDFGEIETFRWKPTARTSLETVDPVTHSQIVHAIEYHLTQSGLREIDSDPDIHVTYHTRTSEDVVIDTTDLGYGYGEDWYWGSGFGDSATTECTYERGTLVIDIWDVDEQRLVWRGWVSGIIPEDPRSATQKIDKAIAKLARRWHDLFEKEDK